MANRFQLNNIHSSYLPNYFWYKCIIVIKKKKSGNYHLFFREQCSRNTGGKKKKKSWLRYYCLLLKKSSWISFSFVPFPYLPSSSVIPAFQDTFPPTEYISQNKTTWKNYNKTKWFLWTAWGEKGRAATAGERWAEAEKHLILNRSDLTGGNPKLNPIENYQMWWKVKQR